MKERLGIETEVELFLHKHFLVSLDEPKSIFNENEHVFIDLPKREIPTRKVRDIGFICERDCGTKVKWTGKRWRRLCSTKGCMIRITKGTLKCNRHLKNIQKSEISLNSVKAGLYIAMRFMLLENGQPKLSALLTGTVKSIDESFLVLKLKGNRIQEIDAASIVELYNVNP